MTCKSLKITEFNNKRNLNTLYDSVVCLNINDSVPEIREFVSWTKSERKNDFEQKAKKSLGGNSKIISDEKIYTLEQVLEASQELLLSKDKRIFNCFFHIVRFDIENFNYYYISCLNEKCNKKVSQEENGLYKCETCHKWFEEVLNTFRIFKFLIHFIYQLI